jgi:hypothetical protein
MKLPYGPGKITKVKRQPTEWEKQNLCHTFIQQERDIHHDFYYIFSFLYGVRYTVGFTKVVTIPPLLLSFIPPPPTPATISTGIIAALT